MGSADMQQIFIAFENEANARNIRRLLEQGGLQVRGVFRSGAQALRCVRRMGGGIVVCGYKLPDMTADFLAENLEGMARVAVVAHEDRLDACSYPRIVRIPAPFTREDLLSAASRLCAEEAPHRLSRSLQETKKKETVARVKAWLMAHEGMDEAAAHRHLQLLSMAQGRSLFSLCADMLAEKEAEKK